MLMDESDRSVTFDRSFVCMQRTESNVGKSRLSRAIFTDERMYDARLEVEIDAAYGNDVTEAFDDAAKSERCG